MCSRNGRVYVRRAEERETIETVQLSNNTSHHHIQTRFSNFSAYSNICVIDRFHITCIVQTVDIPHVTTTSNSDIAERKSMIWIFEFKLMNVKWFLEWVSITWRTRLERLKRITQVPQSGQPVSGPGFWTWDLAYTEQKL
jgi:hypothetical protein